MSKEYPVTSIMGMRFDDGEGHSRYIIVESCSCTGPEETHYNIRVTDHDIGFDHLDGVSKMYEKLCVMSAKVFPFAETMDATDLETFDKNFTNAIPLIPDWLI